jgi:hypothetical protein
VLSEFDQFKANDAKVLRAHEVNRAHLVSWLARQVGSRYHNLASVVRVLVGQTPSEASAERAVKDGKLAASKHRESLASRTIEACAVVGSLSRAVLGEHPRSGPPSDVPGVGDANLLETAHAILIRAATRIADDATDVTDNNIGELTRRTCAVSSHQPDASLRDFAVDARKQMNAGRRPT